jgi:hypothetical protein
VACGTGDQSWLAAVVEHLRVEGLVIVCRDAARTVEQLALYLLRSRMYLPLANSSCRSVSKELAAAMG